MSDMPIMRVDPAEISSLTKEAVVDGLLGNIYSQISGEGADGDVIFGQPPSRTFCSGFLLPRKNLSGDDEVTSPIWMSTLGMQFEILSAAADARVQLQPYGAIYVRVLPSVADLKTKHFRPRMIIRREIRQQIRLQRQDQTSQLRELLGGPESPEWAERKKTIDRQAMEDNGIPAELIENLLDADGHPDMEALAAISDDDDDGGVGVAIVRDAAQALERCQEQFENLEIEHKWLRIQLDLPAFDVDLAADSEVLYQACESASAQLNQAIREQVNNWANSDDTETGGRMWGWRRDPRVSVAEALDWSRALDRIRAMKAPDALPTIELAWVIEKNTNYLDSSRKSIRVMLENHSELAERNPDVDHALFQSRARMLIPKALHAPLRMERVQPSYRYNAHLTYPAMGVNSGVEVVEHEEGQRELTTTWRPRYNQPRIVPTSPNDVPRMMRKLAQPSGLSNLLPLIPAYRQWIEHTEQTAEPEKGLPPADTAGIAKERRELKEDLRKWGDECDAIEAGLSLLQVAQAEWEKRGPQDNAKAMVFEAWLAMNEAMADFMQSKTRQDTAEWRLFQITFIIASIPAIASRQEEWRDHYVPKRDDAVTLLYFATGGGKSEAFMGLLVFTLVLDRLRGKHLGVTALVRYPLRLLTIQQAQRTARVLAFAEAVRRRQHYPGAPFSIGFWVGASGSPNHMNHPQIRDVPRLRDCPATHDAEHEFLDNQKYLSCRNSWRKLPQCPYCRNETGLRRHSVGDQTILGHFCTKASCIFNTPETQPIPFYIVDENIYSVAPSVLLGTIDKLALIGHSGRTIRRILGMFGAAPWAHPHSHHLVCPKNGNEISVPPDGESRVGVAPAYADGLELFHDPFPALIIQDEAHLLEESLGSFAGLFESTLDTMLKRIAVPLEGRVARDEKGNPRRAKVIAASATVNDPQRQLEHLYQREIPAMQFPAPGPSLYKSFYAEPRPGEGEARREHEDPEIASERARVYTAYLTNGRAHTSVATQLLSEFNLAVTRSYRGLTCSDSSRHDEVRARLTDGLPASPLYELHRDALINASTGALATLIDLHRVNLTYVTNKKGGDQLLAAQFEDSRQRHDAASQSITNLDTRLITGSVDQGEIQKVIELAQDRVAPGQPFPPIDEQLRSVIATSAISHGVDVDEFNSMFFAGMPSDIAEYIQASSRVGRTHVGFVLLIPTPQRRRDRHVVHCFDSFHRFLERMVQPAAIDRYAEKAVKRAFPSVMQSYLLGVVPSVDMLSKADKSQVFCPFDVTIVYRDYQRSGEKVIDKISDYMMQAIGLESDFAPHDVGYYREEVREWVRLLVTDVWSSSALNHESVENYFRDRPTNAEKPMTSLRDVDEPGYIQANSGRRAKLEVIRSVMQFIRGGEAS